MYPTRRINLVYQTKIEVINNKVLINDSGNSSIKIFDKSFAFQTEITYSRTEECRAIKYNSLHNLYFCYY
jgi:hypothetical protein